MNVENAVLKRYTEGAMERVEALCCPVDYDQNLLELLPEEVIERDYGCGNPSQYVQNGDVVLDLGSGSGKICYMAAQLVGESGKIIGIDKFGARPLSVVRGTLDLHQLKATQQQKQAVNHHQGNDYSRGVE